MVFTNAHLDWLKDTGISLTTSEGKNIRVLDFEHQSDDVILSAWAKHFRNHYCPDTQIDSLRRGTGLDRRGYLNKIKFPSIDEKPGPSIRAGDFGEVLSADFLPLGIISNHISVSGHQQRKLSSRNEEFAF